MNDRVRWSNMRIVNIHFLCSFRPAIRFTETGVDCGVCGEHVVAKQDFHDIEIRDVGGNAEWFSLLLRAVIHRCVFAETLAELLLELESSDSRHLVATP